MLKEAIILGLVGMMIELTFTSIIESWKRRDLALMGRVSLWMFPVYALGLSYGFDFVMSVIPSDPYRWLSYPLWIWAVEILVGLPAQRAGIEIWNYGDHFQWHWRGLVCWSFAPIWIAFGIIVEMAKGWI